jgi:hypothetical protein
MPCRRFAFSIALALIACGSSPAPTKRPAPASSPAPAPTSPASADHSTPASTLDPCDEVACVIVNYQDACCSKFRKSSSAGAAPAAGAVPDTLTPEMIRQALAPIRNAIVACGDDSAAGHRVKVRVRVHPDGSSEVSIASADHDRLAECVANAVRAATYPPTLIGGSFTQPYVF